MAKVSGPLFSMDARNKLGDALVYLGWKGIKTVRMWLKPAQPKTPKQGDVRLILGGLGRATKAADPTKYYVYEAKKITPVQQSWVSYFIKYIRENVLIDATSFIDQYNNYNAHTAREDFENAASDLGLTTFTVNYKEIPEDFPGGFMVYLLALYGIEAHKIDNNAFNKTPYTKAIGSWNATDITTLKQDLTINLPS
jgi:hypothetical protein